MSVDAAHPVDGDLLDEELLLDEDVVVDGGGGSLVAFGVSGGALLHTRDSTAAARTTGMPTVTFTRMRVQEIWRYPVKSIGGEQLPEAEVTSTGISGDRGWGVFDAATGTVLTARRTPELLFAVARVVDGELVITLPDGGEIGADGHVEMSAWLGREVEIRSAAGSAGGVYENPRNAEEETDWVQWQGPSDAWHDSGHTRLSLVSAASLGDWDIRRFRTNVLTDSEGEDAFVGGVVRVGAIEYDATKRVARCVMVTRPQSGLDRDLDVLRTVNRERGGGLSIGLMPRAGGRIAVGDEVSPT